MDKNNLLKWKIRRLEAKISKLEEEKRTLKKRHKHQRSRDRKVYIQCRC